MILDILRQMTMKITNTKPKGQKRIIFVEVDHYEALTIITSLALQIRNNNCNTGRAEHHSDKGVYFSIGVTPK
jgi:hypothetical protein